MLTRGSKVIGLQVLTIEQGKKVEDVDDLIYDPSSQKVVALLVSGGGIFSEAKVIPFNQIKSIGKDAVIVQSEDVLENASQMGKKVASIAGDGIYLSKTKVITKEGTNLGEIDDIFFDSQTGKVEEFEVSQGLSDLSSGKKKVRVSDIVTVGKDATIVKGYTEAKMEEQKGGVEGMGKKAGQRTKGVLQNVGDRLSDLATKAAGGVEELTGEARKRVESKPVQKRVGQTKEMAKEAGEKVKEEYTMVKSEIKSGRASKRAKEEGKKARKKIKKTA